MRTRSPRTLQQTQPLSSKTISSSLASTSRWSSPTSPNSLTITAVRASAGSRSRFASSVVLPLPRKPVITETGTAAIVSARPRRAEDPLRADHEATRRRLRRERLAQPTQQTRQPGVAAEPDLRARSRVAQRHSPSPAEGVAHAHLPARPGSDDESARILRVRADRARDAPDTQRAREDARDPRVPCRVVQHDGIIGRRGDDDAPARQPVPYLLLDMYYRQRKYGSGR